MNYDLAKKLKDAGFPQDGKYRFRAETLNSGKHVGHERDISAAEYEKLKDECFVPNLSDLIEACGDMFGQLVKYDPDKGHLFVAIGEYPKWEMEAESKVIRTEPYSSPEEGVAKLWLELNKK